MVNKVVKLCEEEFTERFTVRSLSIGISAKKLYVTDWLQRMGFAQPQVFEKVVVEQTLEVSKIPPAGSKKEAAALDESVPRRKVC
jgi:hypothetical protein